MIIRLLKSLMKYFCIFILTIGSFFIVSGNVVHAGEMTMHTLFVGRGDCIIIESNHHYMVVDSGTSDAHNIILNYLDKLNIPENKIDYIISTHPDGDHVGSFSYIFDKYDVGTVLYSPCPKPSDSYTDFIAAIKKKQCDYRTAIEKEEFNLGDAVVKVVYDGSQGSTYNECSIVLKVTCDNKSILLTGDLPSTMERILMEKNYDLKADILKVGHHGAAASSCADFLDAVSPTHAVISSNIPSKTSLPKPSVLKRLARRFIKTYRTTDGNILINVKNGKITTKNKENNGYKSIKKGKITLSNNVYYATGKEIKPSVTLYVDGQKVPSNHYKIKYSSNKKTGVATVKLTASEVKYVSTCKTTFLILPYKETVSGKVSKYNKIKLSWKKQSNATGYQIKYSTDKKLKKNVTTIAVKSPDTITKTFSKLKYNTKYYFRVRAFKVNVGNGKWSKICKIKTDKVPIPGKQKIISCYASGPDRIKLKWKLQSSSDKAGYIIEYSTDKSFSNTKKIQTIKYKRTTKNYRTLRNLKKKTTYYIRIKGYNKYGNGKWSSVSKVKTGSKK